MFQIKQYILQSTCVETLMVQSPGADHHQWDIFIIEIGTISYAKTKLKKLTISIHLVLKTGRFTCLEIPHCDNGL